MYQENLHNEQELLSLIAGGDQQAYERLFDYYWSQVYGVALHLTKSPEQSKDLAQDIILKAGDHREKLPEVKTKEFLINYFAYDESSPHDSLEQKELEEVLQDAINQLPPKLNQVFTLSRFEELSHEEIAKRLGITPLSSKTYGPGHDSAPEAGCQECR